ncbi:hypothetical protein ACLKA7_011837 [Drosophila subpalustris]
MPNLCHPVARCSRINTPGLPQTGAPETIRSLTDVRNKRGAPIDSDHELNVGTIQIKLKMRRSTTRAPCFNLTRLDDDTISANIARPDNHARKTPLGIRMLYTETDSGRNHRNPTAASL